MKHFGKVGWIIKEAFKLPASDRPEFVICAHGVARTNFTESKEISVTFQRRGVRVQGYGVAIYRHDRFGRGLNESEWLSRYLFEVGAERELSLEDAAARVDNRIIIRKGGTVGVDPGWTLVGLGPDSARIARTELHQGI